MIGLVVLGHSPREDHETVYDQLAPGVRRKVVGGLDSFTCEQARQLDDKSGLSPLVCLLSDKTTVEIPLPVLFPYLKKQVDALAAEGATLAVVLCSGGFPRFDCAIPVVLPGMVVPATIYLLFNAGGPAQQGWGIPMATDIAFTLGILTMMGSRVSLPLKVFFTALAIADDLGAILVIAIFYTSEISWISGDSCTSSYRP